MKGRSSSYYLRLVLFCFVLTALPVLLLGILSYGHSSDVVQQNVNAQKRLNLAQMETNVEQLLKTVDQSATHFLSSHMVQTALGEPLSPRQFPLVNQLKSELGFLQRLDSGISDIVLISRTGQWAISNDGLYRLDQLKPDDKAKGYLPFLENPDFSFWSVHQGGGEPAVSGGPSAAATGCAQEIRLVKKLPLTAFQPTGLAVITIPACTLSDQLSLDSERETVLILDEALNPVWSQGLELRDPDSMRLALRQSPASAGQQTVELGGRSISLTYLKSVYTGWTYVSAVPIAQLTQQSRGIGWFTFWICLVLLLLFIGLSLVLSRRMYRPIVALYREVTGDREEPAPGRRVDELQAIGEHVHSMFRTQRELKDRLQGQTEQLKTFFMTKLVLGGMKEEEMAGGLESFGMNREFGRYAVMAAGIDLESTRFSPKDHDLLLFAVHNMVEELLPEGIRLQPILLGRSQVTVITSEGDEQEFRRELFQWAKRIRETVAAVLGVPVYAGISQSYTRLGELPRAYEESVEALGSRVRLGGKPVVDYAELGENRSIQYSYPHRMEKELFEAVKLAEREEAVQLLERLLDEIVRNCPVPHDMQFHAARLLMNLMNLAHSMDIHSLMTADQHRLFDELFRLDLRKEGEGWFLEKVVGPVLEGAAERTEHRHLQLSRELVRIIHEEFETDLSIESCADRLHYNASYLSTVFKKSMNTPFSVYLAQYRHRMATRWLTETERSVKEISERLRYNNPQNFIRSFRKLEGVPPGRYRELHAGGTGGPDGEEEKREKGEEAV